MYSLLRKGELRAPNGNPDLQRELDKHIPIDYIIQWLQSREGRSGVENRYLVVYSGTGSGKSVTLPSRVYNALVRSRYASGGGLICTQPRVFTAIANVKQIASIPEFGSFLKIGDTIGWSTQYSKLRPRRIGFLSATTGILEMQLHTMTDAEIMSLYRYIIIDEVHERPLVSDMTFAALKSFLARNAHLPGCPFVIMMSATIDPNKYARFFLGANKTVDELADNIVICSAVASTYEKKFVWAEKPVANVIEEATRIIARILEEHPAPEASWKPPASGSFDMITQTERDDILVFFPGNAEINKLEESLMELNKARVRQGKPAVTIVQLTGPTVAENPRSIRQLNVPLLTFEYPVERRVILATNVAETGVTLNTLRYVLDIGYSRENEYNPNLRVEVLISKPAPVSRIIQRWGRVGRKFPGVVYPMYTEETHHKLLPGQYPEIATTNLAPIIVQMVFEQQRVKHARGDAHPYFNVADIDMLDLPQPDILLDGLESVYALGFIAHGPTVFSPDIDVFTETVERVDAQYVGVTKLGRVAMELGQAVESPEAIRMIMAGFSWGYRAADLITIAAGSKIEAARPKDKKKKGTPELTIGAAYQYVFPSKAPAHTFEAMNQWRMVLGDTFFDNLVVGAAIDKILATSKEENVHKDLVRFCADINAGFDTVLRFIEMRDNTCSTFLALGFDIYAGASILDAAAAPARDPAELSRAILMYKRCIYDGYKLNMVRWDEKKHVYRTYTGLQVSPGFIEKKFLTSGVIRALVFNKFHGVVSPKTMTYDITAEQVSVLDGFIGDDPLFVQ
jgi:hypothetical protein